MERKLGVIFALMSIIAVAATTQAAVLDADDGSLTSPAHPGAIFDTTTNLMWLDATETQNRSLADVQSELGPGGEFEGWQLATRNQIHQLFVNANIPLTDSALVSDPISQSRVRAFVGIYGQTLTTSSLPGTHLWHANTFDSPGTIGAESVLWAIKDDRYWAGDNGTTTEIAGTALPDFGVALLRSVSGVSGNRIVNPGFDSNLIGWQNTQSTIWREEDAGGSSRSGSARLNISRVSYYAIRSSCVRIRPAEAFFYSASYFIPFGQQATGDAAIQIILYNQADCSGVVLGVEEKVGTQTVWTTIGNHVVAPEGTASIMIALFNHKSGGTRNFTVHFDDVELVAVPEPNGGQAVAMATVLAIAFWRRIWCRRTREPAGSI